MRLRNHSVCIICHIKQHEMCPVIHQACMENITTFTVTISFILHEVLASLKKCSFVSPFLMTHLQVAVMIAHIHPCCTLILLATNAFSLLSTTAVLQGASRHFPPLPQNCTPFPRLSLHCNTAFVPVSPRNLEWSWNQRN